jgi:four helix bundle protein
VGSSFEDLEVWQKAMELVISVYQVTQSFPSDERFGLTSQLRRAAVSIPSNIAEGQGRRSTGEFLNLLSIARGSLMEVRTQLELARRLQYVPEDNSACIKEECNTVGRLLNGLIRSLERKSSGAS